MAAAGGGGGNRMRRWHTLEMRCATATAATAPGCQARAAPLSALHPRPPPPDAMSDRLLRQLVEAHEERTGDASIFGLGFQTPKLRQQAHLGTEQLVPWEQVGGGREGAGWEASSLRAHASRCCCRGHDFSSRGSESRGCRRACAAASARSPSTAAARARNRQRRGADRCCRHPPAGGLVPGDDRAGAQGAQPRDG